jgi:hypothetical protein
MTMRSDVANDPNKVGLAVMSWAVAKKLTDPPTKEADKQAHATRASVRDNPKDGNLENNTKDVKHPTKEPIEFEWIWRLVLVAVEYLLLLLL